MCAIGFSTFSELLSLAAVPELCRQAPVAPMILNEHMNESAIVVHSRRPRIAAQALVTIAVAGTIGAVAHWNRVQGLREMARVWWWILSGARHV